MILLTGWILGALPPVGVAIIQSQIADKKAALPVQCEVKLSTSENRINHRYKGKVVK